LVLRTDKTSNARNHRPLVHHKVLSREGVRAYNCAWENERGVRGAPLFPLLQESWGARKVSRMIAEIAKALRWGDDLHWTLHGLRHGGIGSHFDRLAASVRQQAFQDVRTSERQHVRYGRPNVVRRTHPGAH
jgi:hypothetical protein